VPRGGRSGYPAGGGGSKNGRVWGSGLLDGEVAARSPAGASAEEGHQVAGPTAAMYGMASALVAGDGRGGRGGRQRYLRRALFLRKTESSEDR
jgi:hypothetical protein